MCLQAATGIASFFLLNDYYAGFYYCGTTWDCMNSWSQASWVFDWITVALMILLIAFPVSFDYIETASYVLIPSH